MATNFSQTTVQIQKQTQTLSPQQWLVAQVTELPIEAFEERVKVEMEENPTLERDEQEGEEYDVAENEVTPSTSDDTEGDDDFPTASAAEQHSEPTVGETFYDQLAQQIGFFELDDHQQEILRYLIGSLASDGLLHTPLSQIEDELLVYHNIETSKAELEHLLGVLQSFEPAGVGARTLQECLLLQVQHSPEAKSSTNKQLEELLSNNFDLLTLNRWDKIQARMHLSDAEVSRLQHALRRLNPRPGSALDETMGRSTQQITPDFIVDTDYYGQTTVSLNNGKVPPLRISQEDVDLLQAYEQQDSKQLNRSQRDGLIYLRDRVGKARSFIDAVKQRHHNLMVTMQTIVRLQRPFFESGDEMLLRPMTLEDVASQTGLHFSTVSRVSNSKWVQTSFGTYPLKWFFTAASKPGLSSRSLEVALREIIDAEDKRHPLSDEALTAKLQEQGFDVKRRTVTKHRVILGIPVARLRK